MKHYKENIQYFKRWEGTRTLGMGMLIVGFLSLWLAQSLWMYLGGITLIIAGFVVFLTGNIGRSSEAEILNDVKRHREGIEFPELESDRDYQKRVPARPEIYDFEGFVLREGLYFKKMKNGSICSSEYARARLYPLTDAFLIKTKTFSLVAEEEALETCEIPFSEVEDIESVSERKILHSGKKSFSAKVCHFVITYGGGKQLFLVSRDDAEVDELIVKLKKTVKDANQA